MVVKDIVEELGGVLTVESSEGDGTTFQLLFPAAHRL